MTDHDALRALEEKVESLTRQLGVVEDTHAIRCLHFAYGYEACALFARDGAARFQRAVQGQRRRSPA